MAVVSAADVFAAVEHSSGKQQANNIRKYINAQKSVGKVLAMQVAVRDRACYICGSEITHFDFDQKRFIAANGQIITFDHILPKALNGADMVVNGKAACYKCNQLRADKIKLNTVSGQIRIEAVKIVKISKIVSIINKMLWHKKISNCMNKYFYEALCEKYPELYVIKDDIDSFIAFVEHEIGLILKTEDIKKMNVSKIGIIKTV
jgi:hypothetical protein